MEEMCEGMVRVRNINKCKLNLILQLPVPGYKYSEYVITSSRSRYRVPGFVIPVVVAGCLAGRRRVLLDRFNNE